MKDEKRKTAIRGTREWSVASVNCVLGCGHRCRYCYARADALRRKQISDWQEWGTTYHRLRPREVEKRRRKMPGTVMFPTTHDILPEFLEPCLRLIENVLVAGNRLLIVSKPHLPCIEAICREFGHARDRIRFRFSIGARGDQVLRYWEPHAPRFGERLASLHLAQRCGFGTSVSCEPLLDDADVIGLVEAVAPYVDDSIWIGKLNGIPQRIEPGTDREAVARIELGQTPARIREIYAVLRDHPLVRWKDSYKQALGLVGPSVPGTDR